jgi:hypothetical protein
MYVRCFLPLAVSGAYVTSMTTIPFAMPTGLCGLTIEHRRGRCPHHPRTWSSQGQHQVPDRSALDRSSAQMGTTVSAVLVAKFESEGIVVNVQDSLKA